MAKKRKRIDNGGACEVVVGDPHAGKASLKKRKKGGCLNAFIITLCVTVGLLAILIVGGLFIGDAVMKNNVGVSLFDVFAVIGDVGDHDRDKIVTNGYTDSDVNAFYESANDMLYFKSGENAVLNSAYIKELMSETAAGNTDSLMTSLLGVLTAENFDTDKLGAYKGWRDDVDHVGELTTISDRQFAAFFDDLIIKSGVIDGMIPDLANVLGDKQIKDIVDLEQLIIRKAEDMSAERLAELGGVTGHAYMTLTVRIDLKNAVNALLPTLDAQAGFQVSMFGWLIDWILPDTTYATATVDLDDAAYGVNIELNSLAAETCEMGAAPEAVIAKYRDENGQITKMDRAFIVIESFSGFDVRAELNKAASDPLGEGGSSVLGYLCKSESGFSVANAIEMNTLALTDNGDTFKIDLYGMMADILNDQTGGNAQAEDIIILMQALMCTEDTGAYADDFAHRADMYSPTDIDLAEALQACGFASFEDIKTEEDYLKLKDAYGAIGYKTQGADLTGQINVFEQEFIDKMAETYCLDLQKYNADGSPTGEKYTFSEIAALFGMASGEGAATSLELTDLLDGAKFAQAAGDPDVKTLQITDRMLGAVMRALMPDFVNSSGYGDYGLELRTLKIARRTAADGMPHDLVTVVFSLKTSEMLKEGLAQNIGGVLPAYIAMGIEVDMTPNLAADKRLPAEITRYNDITATGSAGVLNGLTSDKFVNALENIVPNINLDQLLATMSDGISSVVDNMTAALPTFAFVPSSDNSAYYAEFPSLFDLAAQLMGLNDPAKAEEDRVSGEELKSAVDYLVNYTYDDSKDVAPDAKYDAFLASVQQNYYLNAQLTDFDSIFASLTGTFDAASLRLNQAASYNYGGQTVWYNGMLYDPRAASELNVEISETDLVAIMREFAAASLNQGTELIRAEVTEHGIMLYVRIDVSTMIEEKYRALVGCDYIYGSVAIDLSVIVEDNGKRYGSVITVNGQGAGGEDYATLMRLIKAFGVQDFDLEGIARDVGRSAYDALVNLDGAKLEYTLNAVNGKIVLPSFYEYAMTLLNVDKTVYAAGDMKAAMQGIRAAAANTAADKYYVNVSGEPVAANTHNFNAAAVVKNPLVAGTIDPTDLIVSGTITDPTNCIVGMLDNQLGKWVADTKRTGGDSLGEFVQLSALPKGAKNDAAAGAYAFANGFNGGLAADGDYVAFTFKTDMNALFSAGAELTGVLPDSVYMTLVYAYDKTQTEPLTLAYLRVNGLTELQQTLLIEELCGFTDFDASVRQHAGDAAGLIADLGFDIDSTMPAGDTACGRFTLALANLTA